MTQTVSVQPPAPEDDDSSQLIVSFCEDDDSSHGGSLEDGKSCFSLDCADDDYAGSHSEDDKPALSGQRTPPRPRPRPTSTTTTTGQLSTMPSAPPRRLVPKDRFAYVFGTLKTQTYHDPAARGPGSHKYVIVLGFADTAHGVSPPGFERWETLEAIIPLLTQSSFF
jgi:hypothetical protein